MSAHEQLDLAGTPIPLDELELRGHALALAQHERETGQKLTADEAGALVHARRGKHGPDERCAFCTSDGTTELIRLNTRRHEIEARRQAAQGPGWTCPACGHENPGDARSFCRSCAAIRPGLDDPEPHVPEYDPASSEWPKGF